MAELIERQEVESNSMEDLKSRIAKAEQAMHQVQKILRKERDRNANDTSFIQDITLNLSDDNGETDPQLQQHQRPASSAVWRLPGTPNSSMLAPRISTPKPTSAHNNGLGYQAPFSGPKDSLGVSAIELDNGQLRSKLAELRSENMGLLKQSQESKLREEKLKAEVSTLKNRIRHLEMARSEQTQPTRDRDREFDRAVEREVESRTRDLRTECDRRLDAAQRDAERAVRNAEAELSDLRNERDVERRMRVESEKQRDASLKQLDEAQTALLAASRKQNVSNSLNNKRERDADEALIEHVRAANEDNLRLLELANAKRTLADRIAFERDALRTELQQAAEHQRELQTELAEKDAALRRVLAEKDAALADASAQVARARAHNELLQRTLDDKHREMLEARVATTNTTARERAERLDALERSLAERERRLRDASQASKQSETHTQTQTDTNVPQEKEKTTSDTEGDQLRHRLAALQAEIDTLSVRFELKDAHLAERDAEVRALNVRLLDFGADHERTCAQLDAARTEATRSRKLRDDLERERNEERAARERECNELRSQLERLGDDLRTITAENRRLKDTAAVGSAEVGRVRAEFDELVRRLNTEREQCERMRGELRAVQADHSFVANERGDLKTQLDDAVAARERAERELANTTAENRRLAALISQENAERERLVAVISAEQETFAAHRERLEQTVAVGERTVAALREEMREQAHTIGRLEKDLIDRQRLLEQTLSRLEQMDGEKHFLQVDMERTNAAVLNEMQSQVTTMSQDLAELDSHSKRVEQALQEARDALRAKTTEMAELQTTQRSQLAKLEQERRNADLALESTRRQAETLSKLRDDCLNDFNNALRQKQDAETRVRELAATVRRLEDDAVAARTERTAVAQRLEDAESRANSERQRAETLARECDAHSARIVELERESARCAQELHDRVASLESRIATDFDAQVRTLAAENERLRTEASSNARRAADLDATRRELESALRDAQTMRNRNESAQQRLANELTLQTERFAQLERELDAVRHENTRVDGESTKTAAALKQAREEVQLVAAANVRLKADMADLQSEHERLLNRLEECAQLLVKKEDEVKAVFHQATVLQSEKTDGERRMAQRVLQLEQDLVALRRRGEQDAARFNDALGKLAAAKLATEQEATRRVEAIQDERRRTEAELRSARDAAAERDTVIEKQKRMLIDAEQTILVKDSTIGRLEMRLKVAGDSTLSNNTSLLSNPSFVAQANDTRSSFTSGNAARTQLRNDDSITQLRMTVDDFRNKFLQSGTSHLGSPSKDDSVLVTPRTAAAYQVVKSASHNTTRLANAPSDHETAALLLKVDRDLAKARLPFVSQSTIRHSLVKHSTGATPVTLERRPINVPEPTRVDGEPRRPVRFADPQRSSLGVSTSAERSLSLADEFILVPGTANASATNRSMLTTASADSSGSQLSPTANDGPVWQRGVSTKPHIVPRLMVSDSEDENESSALAARRVNGRMLPPPAGRISNVLDSQPASQRSVGTHSTSSTADTVVPAGRLDGLMAAISATPALNTARIGVEAGPLPTSLAYTDQDELALLADSAHAYTKAEQDIIKLRDRLEALRLKRQA